MSVIFLVSACKEKKTDNEKSTKPIEVQSEAQKPNNVEVMKEEVRPAPKPIVRKVIVKEGEWLYDISRREYGNAQGWIKIYNANKEQINNPDLIYPNQELIIPD